jgi:hypothetical protein
MDLASIIGGDGFSLLKSKDMDLNCVVSSFLSLDLDLDWNWLFFSFFFIANARQTSLNPSMNRDQQRREMGGPLVRWRQIQPSYIQIRLERLNDTLPSSSFYNQQRLCLSLSSTTFRHLTMATFRVGREERPKKNEGSHSSAWLAGSVVLESWCLLLLTGWLTDWLDVELKPRTS